MTTHDDRLGEIIRMQRELADFIFKKRDIRGRDGAVLKCADVADEIANLEGHGVFHLPVPPFSLVNEWAVRTAECIADECRELDELLPWKYWASDGIGERAHPDATPSERLAHVRIELIDIIFFAIEGLIMMGADDSRKIYRLAHDLDIPSPLCGVDECMVDEDMLTFLVDQRHKALDTRFELGGARARDGNVLTVEKIATAARELDLTAVGMPNTWLRLANRRIKASADEIMNAYTGNMIRLANPFKRSPLKTALYCLGNIVGCAIDGLLMTGSGADEIYDVYKRKHAKNINRQHEDYRIATKTEADNDEIARATASAIVT